MPTISLLEYCKKMENRLSDRIDSGLIDWKEPYAIEMTNFIHNRRYSTFNSHQLSNLRYASPFWITPYKISEKGYTIKPNEDLSYVVRRYYSKSPTNLENLVDAENSDEKISKKSNNDFFNNVKFDVVEIYNIQQLKEYDELRGSINPPHPNEELAEQIISALSNKIPTINFGADVPEYNGRLDKITVPPKTHYKRVEEYYSSIFHEIIHSLCNKRRSIVKSFSYDEEEIIAELGTSYIRQYIGMGNRTSEKSSTDYIHNYLSRIKNKPEAYYHITMKVRKVVNYILKKHDSFNQIHGRSSEYIYEVEKEI